MLSESIDLLHKSHNAPVLYPTMHQFITEMCTILLQNRALWVIFLIRCTIYEMDQLIHNCSLWQLLLITKSPFKDSQPYWNQSIVEIDEILSRGSYEYALVIYQELKKFLDICVLSGFQLCFSLLYCI